MLLAAFDALTAGMPLDKAEAIMEPSLLTRFSDADTNKDGKVSKEEFLNFYKNKKTAGTK